MCEQKFGQAVSWHTGLLLYIYPQSCFMKRALVLLLWFVGSGWLPAQAQNAFVDSLLQWLDTHPKVDTTRVYTLHRVSYRLSEIDPGKAWRFARETEQAANQLDYDRGRVLANINYAILEGQDGKFDRSTDYYLKALKIAERTGFVRGITICYNNIGDDYRELKDYPNALLYAHRALEVNRASRETRGQAINLELIGSIYYILKDYRASLKYYKEALPLALSSKDRYVISQVLVGLGKNFAALHDYPNAIRNIHEAILHAEEEHENINIINAYRALADVYSDQQQIDSAQYYLTQAMQLAIEMNSKVERSNVALDLSALFEKRGQLDSSLWYYKEYKAVSDSFLNEKNLAHISFIQTQFETEIKEEENKKLRGAQYLKDRELKQKNLLLLASAIMVCLLILSAILIYKAIQTKQQQKLLAEQRRHFNLQQHVHELELRALRSQMNPHFIFNSMNSIRNFILQQNPDEASDYLAKFASLMRMILDSSTQTFVLLEDEIKMLELYLDLEALRFSDKFQHRIVVDTTLDASDIRIPPMMVQPFIENAIWHGLLNKKEGKGEIRVLFHDFDTDNTNLVTCQIEDNGIGRVKAAEIKKAKLVEHQSRGIHLTMQRLQILGDELELQTSTQIIDLYDSEGHATGTRVMMQLPVK